MRDREAKTGELGGKNLLEVLSILPCGCILQEENDIMSIRVIIICNQYGARLKQEVTSPSPQGN